MTQYENPPLVEAWIAFDFEPNPDKVAWDKSQIEAFTKTHSNDFARIEMMVREEVRIEQASKKELPRITHRKEIIDVVRMFNEAGTRIKQVGEDRIAYNLLRTAQEEYPGFGRLLDEALKYLNQYRGFFQPQSIRLATIHYVDLIEIPLSDEPTILTDYFAYIPDIPDDPFGLTIGYALGFVTKCPLDGAPLSTNVAIVPSPDPSTLRVRLDWEKPCPGLNFQDKSEIRAGLKRSKEFVVNCFERLITDKTRSLFKKRPT
jgi:uncharacterized protein (TIGR04255 family)